MKRKTVIIIILAIIAGLMLIIALKSFIKSAEKEMPFNTGGFVWTNNSDNYPSEEELKMLISQQKAEVIEIRGDNNKKAVALMTISSNEGYEELFALTFEKDKSEKWTIKGMFSIGFKCDTRVWIYTLNGVEEVSIIKLEGTDIKVLLTNGKCYTLDPKTKQISN